MPVDISNAVKIEGWMTEPELQWLGEQAAKHRTICEVGSWMGRSTRALGDNALGVVYAVDTWAGSNEPKHVALLADKHPDWLFEQFCANIGDDLLKNKKWMHENGIEQQYVVRPYRGTSLEGADYLGNGCYNLRFDMIFLDASHDYENVEADLAAWAPLLKPGGLMCGHDFGGSFPGVARAVRNVYPKANKVGAGSIWSANL